MSRNYLLIAALLSPINVFAQVPPPTAPPTVGGTIGGIPFGPPPSNPPPSRDNRENPDDQEVLKGLQLDKPPAFGGAQKFDPQKFNLDVNKSLQEMRSRQQFR